MRGVRLSTIAVVTNGKTPAVADQRTSGHPVLKIRDVDALGQFRGSFASFVDEGFAAKHDSKRLREGDTLILNAAHNAEYVASKTFYATCSLGSPLVTGEWMIVRPNSGEVDPSYLKGFLQSETARRAIKTMVNGIHLYPKDVSTLRVHLPPLPEQRRIAAILDKADALRAKRRQAMAKLDQLLQSVFLEMFGDPVTNPKGWPIATVETLATFITSGSRGWAKYYAESGTKFIRIQNLIGGNLDLTDCAYVNAPETAEAKRTRVREGDILVSITADLGRTAVVPPGIGDAYINQHIAILRLTGVDPTFAAHYLASAGGKHQFDRLNRAGVKAGLNFNDLRALTIAIPPIERQHQYLQALQVLRTQSDKATEQLQQVNALAMSLQTQAFMAPR